MAFLAIATMLSADGSVSVLVLFYVLEYSNGHEDYNSALRSLLSRSVRGAYCESIWTGGRITHPRREAAFG